MTYAYSLTRRAQSKMHRFGYYNRPGFSLLRRFAGPTIALLGGAYAFVVPLSTASIVMSAFFVLFGLYYTLRPIILIKQIKLEETKGTIAVSDSEIRFVNELGELHITKEKLLKVFVKNDYLFIQALVAGKRYYLVDLRSITGNAEAFVAEMRTLANRPS